MRLWVEIEFFNWFNTEYICQPPCEAVSWNENIRGWKINRERSASLWGCELKSLHSLYNSCGFSQPPCEAVSWNITNLIDKNNCCPVSLLVRLWVEMLNDWNIFRLRKGQPPCEAVSWNTPSAKLSWKGICQPPCEAVSWNTSAYSSNGWPLVSLLVRLWVEMFRISL